MSRRNVSPARNVQSARSPSMFQGHDATMVHPEIIAR
jgi:hypothetical protein